LIAHSRAATDIACSLRLTGKVSLDSGVSVQSSTAKAELRSERRVSLATAPSPESDLVARLKLGGEDAAHEFFDRYAARIRRFIASSLRADTAEADDILQETLIALADALPFFRGDSSLFTFACAIAHRKVQSFVRTKARRARLMRSAPIAEYELPSTTDTDPNFRNALVELRPEYREVLLLKYVEEVAVTEIAAVLRLSEHAVESRLARARKALRKKLKE
jgi:RNA polymerase sigma-70 factor, ECF subfamily